MVGEGVLNECLNNDTIGQILVINRRPCGITHSKLKEIIHSDFLDLLPIEQEFKDFNACFFCLGVSSVGMKEDRYRHLTYDLTMHMAELLAKNNPNLIFCYISGAATDSSEKGKVMWARVKGKTENDLMKLSFKKVYNFHPGLLIPTKGAKYTHKFYKYFRWLIPIMKIFAPRYVCTLKELGLAMINSVWKGYSKNILEIADIKSIAQE